MNAPYPLPSGVCSTFLEVLAGAYAPVRQADEAKLRCSMASIHPSTDALMRLVPFFFAMMHTLGIYDVNLDCCCFSCMSDINMLFAC